MPDEVLDKPEVKYVRWIATVYYRSELGLIDVQHDIEELDQLQDLVERGPNWDAIDHIHIDRADGKELALTVEEAERL